MSSGAGPKSFHGVPLVALPPDVSRILYVANLDASVTGETLYRVFHKFGALRQLRVGDTDDTKGTAFVVFASVFDAQRAQSHLNGFVVAKNAKPLLVRFFDEKKRAAAAQKKVQRRQREEQLQKRKEEMQSGGSAAAVAATAAGGSMGKAASSEE